MPGESILIIDDDELLLTAVSVKLRGRGYRVNTATTGSSGRRMLREESPDLLILDLMLPDEDGMEICRDVRNASPLPILILSGRTDTTDRVLGLEIGADDYVTKPFSLAELAVRVKALIRRAAMRAGLRLEEDDRKEASGIILDPASRRALVAGKQVDLTATEYKLLDCLMTTPGRIFAKKELAQAIWGTPVQGLPALTGHIANLRAKLVQAGAAPQIIRNVRSLGYRLG